MVCAGNGKKIRILVDKPQQETVMLEVSVPSILGDVMSHDDPNVAALLERIRDGDAAAIDEVFVRYRERLKRMVWLRLDRRLQGRVDASDVLQEAFIDISRRAKTYVQNPNMPLFLWLRFLTGQRLLAIHRQHLGTKKRDAGQEISLHRGALPQANSVSLASLLLGQLTSPTEAVVRAEVQIKLQEALNTMDPVDREIIALRHFEELSNNETADVLGLHKAAASVRYMRALKRLKEILDEIPGFFDYLR
jgi:RNA polymerase sigma-70 factor (ECF subfamily)